MPNPSGRGGTDIALLMDMSTRHIHLTLPGDLAEAVAARHAATTQAEGEGPSLVRVIRRLIRAGLAAEVACATTLVTSGR